MNGATEVGQEDTHQTLVVLGQLRAPALSAAVEPQLPARRCSDAR